MALFYTPPPAHAQDQEEIKGTAEPADAQEIRSQIAAVELQHTLPDRGAALGLLAAAREHLRIDREATLLKECLALQEGLILQVSLLRN